MLSKYDEMITNIYLPNNDLIFYLDNVSGYDGDMYELREKILYHMVNNKTSCQSVEYEFFMGIIKNIDKEVN